LLRLLGEFGSNPWLQGCLHLVALRLQHVCSQRICDVAAAHYADLKSALPRKVWRKACRRCPAFPSLKQCSEAASPTSQSPATCSSRAESALAGGSNSECSTLALLRKQQKLAIAHVKVWGSVERNSAIEKTIAKASAAIEAQDSNAMMTSVLECVSLLSPRRCRGSVAAHSPMGEEATIWLCCARQARLRSVLTQLLGLRGQGGLDLEDVGTCKLLRVPLKHLHNILMKDLVLEELTVSKDWRLLAHAVDLSSMQRKASSRSGTSDQNDQNVKNGTSEDTGGLHPLSGPLDAATTQVMESRRSHRPVSTSSSLPFEKDSQSCQPDAISSLTFGNHGAPLSSNASNEDVQITVPIRKHAKKEPRAKWAKTGETYEPSERAKLLTCVVHFPQEPRELLCAQCGQIMTCHWYFVHPKTQKKFILRPSKGHSACSTHFKRICHYRVVNGFQHKADSFDGLDFCEHKRKRSQCASCGGRDMCEHLRQRSSCALCRHLVMRRNRRVS